MFLIILLVHIYAQIATPSCSTLSTSTTCNASGYCWYKGSTCINIDCHLVTEVSACRSGGALISACGALSTLNTQYANVCDYGVNPSITYAFVVFPITTTGSATQTTSAVTVSTLTTTTTQLQYLYQLFTVNVQIATSAQLSAILTAYNNFNIQLLLTTTHPYYMEKTVYQAVQNIRDDITMTNAIRQPLLAQIWTLATTLMMRISTFQAQYITNYYFIGFASTTLSRRLLTIQGNGHTLTAAWNVYSDNGFFQIIQMTPATFGIQGAKSDAMVINIYKTDALSALTSPLSYTLTYVWTDIAYIPSAMKVYTFDRTSWGTTVIQYTPTITVTCTQATLTCVTGPITVSGNFFFAESVINTCSSSLTTSALCRTAFCATSWAPPSCS